MKVIALLIRLLLLALSCCGYLQYLKKYVKAELAIGLLFSTIGSVLFLVGILNLLKEAAVLIWLGGLILLLCSLRRKESLAGILTFGTIFFATGCLFFLCLFPGSRVQHHDSYIHWALVAKIITQQGRFPVGTDANVLFSSYPVGSACFLFYITQALGLTSEWVLMAAQAMLMLGMLTGLFVFAKGFWQKLATALCCVFLLCGNSRLTELMVDSLLPITALNAVALCVYDRQLLRRMPWILLSYAVFLVGIKNSGFFFVVILYGFVWYLSRKEPLSRKTWLTLLGVPAAAFFLWQKHVSLVFPAGMLSKHAMSLSNYSHVLHGKDLHTMLEIALEMGRKIFSLNNQALWLLASVFFVCLLWLRFDRDSGRPLLRALVLAAVSYGLYQLGTYAMYLFSMPLQESLILASYSRYHKTILLFLSGLIYIGLLQSLNLRDGKSLRALVPLGALVLCFFAVSPNLTMLGRQDYTGTNRQKFDTLIALYEIPEGKDYLILTTDENYYANELPYMAAYLLSSHQVVVERDADFRQAQLADFDYLIVFEETEAGNAIAARYSPEGAPVVRLK